MRATAADRTRRTASSREPLDDAIQYIYTHARLQHICMPVVYDGAGRRRRAAGFVRMIAGA